MVPDVVIQFRLDGSDKQVVYRKLPFNAWGHLKSQLGFTPVTLVSALGDWDLDAVAAVIWLERKQRERKLAFSDVRQSLMDDDHDFEVTDIIAKGRSTFGGEPADVEDEDPTRGS